MATNPNDLIDSWNNADSHNVGLTKREHFAAMAMQGMLSNDVIANGGPEIAESVSRIAVKFADRLIAELNKEQK